MRFVRAERFRGSGKPRGPAGWGRGARGTVGVRSGTPRTGGGSEFRSVPAGTGGSGARGGEPPSAVAPHGWDVTGVHGMAALLASVQTSVAGCVEVRATQVVSQIWPAADTTSNLMEELPF